MIKFLKKSWCVCGREGERVVSILVQSQLRKEAPLLCCNASSFPPWYHQTGMAEITTKGKQKRAALANFLVSISKSQTEKQLIEPGEFNEDKDMAGVGAGDPDDGKTWTELDIEVLASMAKESGNRLDLNSKQMSFSLVTQVGFFRARNLKSTRLGQQNTWTEAQPRIRPHLAPYRTGSPGKGLGASINRSLLIAVVRQKSD